MIGKMAIKKSFMLTLLENKSTAENLRPISREQTWVEYYNNAELKTCIPPRRINAERRKILEQSAFQSAMSAARKELEESKGIVVVIIPPNMEPGARAALGLEDWEAQNVWYLSFDMGAFCNGSGLMKKLLSYETERRQNHGVGHLEMILRMEEKRKSHNLPTPGVHHLIRKKRTQIRLLEQARMLEAGRMLNNGHQQS